MTADLPADFDASMWGQPLPDEAGHALQQASALRADPAAEMAALMRAAAAAPEHPAVLIAFYRSHFYGHRLQPARDVARRALVVGARALGLPAVWRDVPRRPLPGAQHDPGTRFFLFTLKGLAYLGLRLGDSAEAREALSLLRALDPEDRVGAALLEDVRQRALRRPSADVDDDDLDDDGPGALPGLRRGPLPTGAAAWAALAPAA